MNITDGGILNLSQGLSPLKCLEILTLNLDSWGIKSQKISDSSVKALINIIGNLVFLKRLDLNLA